MRTQDFRIWKMTSIFIIFSYSNSLGRVGRKGHKKVSGLVSDRPSGSFQQERRGAATLSESMTPGLPYQHQTHSQQFLQPASRSEHPGLDPGKLDVCTWQPLPK